MTEYTMMAPGQGRIMTTVRSQSANSEARDSDTSKHPDTMHTVKPELIRQMQRARIRM